MRLSIKVWGSPYYTRRCHL